MTPNAGFWMRRLAVPVIAMSLLTACATAGSDAGGPVVCPPVVEYSPEDQARAAEELDLLPEGSVVVEMLSDYAVMRGRQGGAVVGGAVMRAGSASPCGRPGAPLPGRPHKPLVGSMRDRRHSHPALDPAHSPASPALPALDLGPGPHLKGRIAFKEAGVSGGVKDLD